VHEDIDRVREIWRECRVRYEAAGGFLFGEFTAVDAMFAPVTSRFQTYGVELERVEAEYADAILALPTVKEWIKTAREEPWSIAKFDEA
jgi:glutathione S-transferase